jgi:surface antigen
MNDSKLSKLKSMTYEQLIEEIPNYEWFINLNVGDDAVLWLPDAYYFRKELNDNGYTHVQITSVNKDGSVEISKGNLGKFYFCRLPNEMDAIVALIPPREEYLNEIKKYEVVKRLCDIQWNEISFKDCMKVIEILDNGGTKHDSLT